MGMPVEARGDGIAIQRPLEARRAHEGEDLGIFTDHGVANRCVVQEDDLVRGVQARQCTFEAHGLIYGFLHEILDRGFTPRVQHPAAKSSAEPANSGKAHAVDLCGVAVQDSDFGVLQNGSDFFLMCGLVIVITEDCEDGDAAVHQILHDHARFIRKTVVGQIAAKQKHIRRVRSFEEELAPLSFAVPVVMQVARGRDAESIGRNHHLVIRGLAPTSRVPAPEAIRHRGCHEKGYMNVTPMESSDEFYVAAVHVLQDAKIPFLVGGAYALRHYTGVARDTKDFDVFLAKENLQSAIDTFHKAGYRADIAYGHWLAKVHYGESFIDLIFRAGNGLCDVTDKWFRGNREVELMGAKVNLVRAEHMIWQKCYIQERERFDGADIAHLLLILADELDWEHLLECFGPDWRVLLSHLIMFGFIYPEERARIPQRVMKELLSRAEGEAGEGKPNGKVCQGTLISRAQYLPDIERWGFKDARETGRCKIQPEEIEAWTNAIGKERAWA